jgi:hypothetical protein
LRINRFLSNSSLESMYEKTKTKMKGYFEYIFRCFSSMSCMN